MNNAGHKRCNKQDVSSFHFRFSFGSDSVNTVTLNFDSFRNLFIILSSIYLSNFQLPTDSTAKRSSLVTNEASVTNMKTLLY